MAQYKLNTFQWHLVDNQGWRIEIKKYPKLTSVGGYDVNTVIDANRDELDGVSTGGFYTQEQVKEIVRYAEDRFITIVPEIEMPAHSVAALRAYPEFKCVLPEDSKNLWANRIIYCPSEQTFKFLEDVIDEVITLFPGKYIHIGGDEAIKTPWEESIFCQDLMKKLQIKDVYGLQSYFLKRMEKYINSKNRSIIGWDEISQGGLAPNATVTCRFGEREAIKIIQYKHNLIMGPGSQGLYFDYPQSNSFAEPTFHGRYPTSLLKTYSYNPVPESLTQDEKKLILGVQANIWTEHIATMSKLYFRTVPRIFALAEIAWTLPENKNQKNFFEVSVPKHLYSFEKKGYNFCVPTAFYETDQVLFGSKITLQNQSTMINSKTYYTLNGHTPTECDREFTKPLEFNIPKNERRELQTIVITSTGKRSMPTRTVMFNYEPFPAVSITDVKPGIYYRTYNIDPQDTAMVHLISGSGILTNLKIDSLIKGLKNFKIIGEGFINAQSDDIYTFYLPIINENKLFIDGKSIIADDRNFSRFDKLGAVPLKKGYHKFRLEYITEGNPTEIPLYMQNANSEKIKISPDLLFH
jgi:hexosaminidase